MRVWIVVDLCEQSQVKDDPPLVLLLLLPGGAEVVVPVATAVEYVRLRDPGLADELLVAADWPSNITS